MYTTPLSQCIDAHPVQHEMFADDTQLCKSASPTDSDRLISSLQKCTADVKDWMNTNKLKLNDEKTEAIRFSTPSLDQQVQMPSTFSFGSCVRDLGQFTLQ